MQMRFLTVGSDGVLVELDDLAAALALLDHLQAEPIAGVLEMVPAAQTLLLRYNPEQLSKAALIAQLSALNVGNGAVRRGALFEIPVSYDGEDLAEVAELLGWSIEELIRRHQAAEFTVAFTGFAPGFAYMTCSDPAFDVPRRTSPRVRIPAGSVALAGKFGGIYPSDSPGGWQILGQTPLPMWDLTRPRPALLAPGDRVVFRDMAKGATVPAPRPAQPEAAPNATPALSVTSVLYPALYQDEGRPFQAAQGLARSGALDQRALRDLNRLLGNPRGTPAIELTLGSLAVRAEAPVTAALAGASAELSLTRPDGRVISLDPTQPFAMDRGDQLRIGAPKAGFLSYFGIRGGFAVEKVLGSASRDSLAKVGPAPITLGTVLRQGQAPLRPAELNRTLPELPKAGAVVDLDIHLGPRDDWFTDEGLRRLTAQLWEVTTEISRTGKRLSAPQPLERRDHAELPSEATVPGAIQVPHSGQPVLFLSDHPLTGGYPVIAVIAKHHLDLAAQLPPGTMLRFHPLTSGA